MSCSAGPLCDMYFERVLGGNKSQPVFFLVHHKISQALCRVLPWQFLILHSVLIYHEIRQHVTPLPTIFFSNRETEVWS